MSALVDIVVERQWHAPALAQALMSKNILGNIITGFPKSRYTSIGVPLDKILSNPLPALWNHLAGRLKLARSIKINESRSLAAYAANCRTLSPVITSLATTYQDLFPKILGQPIIRVIECGSMHPEDHFHFQQRGRREAGLEYSTTLPPCTLAEIEASKLAHFLVCGSRMVADSYINRGYSPDRVLLCPYGADIQRFQEIQRDPPRGRAIRIATVGVIGIRKGIARLLRLAEWAMSRGVPVELHLIGPVEPEAEGLIQKTSAGQCVLRKGVLKGQALVAALHDADVYCLPSYEEGFPISQIEAMCTGLASITSNDTGGREALLDGESGLILSDFSSDEFSAKLLPWFRNPATITAAGRSAALRARSLYSSQQYTNGVLRCYGIALEYSARMVAGETISSAYVR